MNHTRIGIESATNPRVKIWRSLLTARGIKRHELAILSGSKIIGELCEQHASRVDCFLVNVDSEPIAALSGSGKPVYLLSSPLFRELDVHGTDGPLAVVTVPAFPRMDTIPGNVDCVLCLPFQDPANIGAAVRSAAAFGVETVVLLSESAHPFHPKSARAGGTALLSVRCYRGPSIERLDTEERQLVMLDTAGESLRGYSFPDRFALLPGIEGPGLPDTLKGNIRLTIPMSDTVESLNAASSVAVALYEWRHGSE